MAPDLEMVLDLLARYGYVIVFFAALAEAFPFLSILVPGQAVVIVAGAAAALGHLSLANVILVAIPAGILGDWAGFLLGRRYGRGVLERFGPVFRVTSRHLDASDRLFERYGAFALVLFRFSFLTRPVGPLLAGVSRMKGRVFWVWNVVGAILWAAAYSLVGYFFGFAFLELEGVIGRVLAWTVVAIVGMYLLYRLLKRYADQFTREDAYLVAMGASAGAVFGVLADRLSKNGTANILDEHAHGFLEMLAPVRAVFHVMELIGSFEVLGAAALGLLVYLAARRMAWEASLVGLGIGGAILGVEILQPVFANVVPLDAQAGGFPSSYAAVSLVAGGVLTYLIASHTHRARGPLAAAVGGAGFSFLAALARVAQGKELPSAAFGGMMLGAAWLSLAILLIEFALKRTPAPRAQPAHSVPPAEER